MNLIQQLIKKGILDKDQATSLEYQIKSSDKTAEEVILDRRLITESFLFNLKSKNIKIPLKKVFPEDVSLKVLELIPEDSAKYYKMMPLAREDSVVEIGMVYPEDLKAREALKFLARQGKFSYKIYLITLSDYGRIFRKYRNLRKEVARALEELEVEMQESQMGSRPLRAAEVERLAEEAPISKVVAVLLRHAVEGRASDIHVEPVGNRLRVRFRVLGILHSSIFLPLSYLISIVARVKILANLRIDESRIPQDGRFSARIDGKKIDFRVSTFPITFGEKVAIRVLDSETGLKSFKDLGLEDKSFSAVNNAVKKACGMILTTGPTGCGKTTTLYAMLQILNKESVNIMTLEDPIEYFIEGVNQSQIKPEIEYTFARGLRHILRQDPDIIMVGEMRDAESAKLAIHAALTGHLVLSTLHTSNAAGVIPRLIDLGVEPYLISPTLNVILAQRLVRKLCDFCKEKIVIKGRTKDLILKEIKDMPELDKKKVKLGGILYVYKPVGCRKCAHTGYSGRIGIFETMEMTDELAEIILKEPSEVQINQEAKRQRMVTMRQDGVIKALKGITTIEEVIRVAEEQ
ncbi:MAG: type II/IV secretion system protein [Candidatus Pacebacteria bacterium]|nr:type II/IV secretion system protein [Candidatus Paceibacterota bacterium]